MDWDVLLLGVAAFLCSILGWPWMCSGPVQSIAHCTSLSVTKETKTGAKAGKSAAMLASQQQSISAVDYVIEQRVTTFAVAMLIGSILVVGPYMRIPLACLFGVFLYLGVRNLLPLTLTRRLVALFSSKNSSDVPDVSACGCV